MLKLDLMKKYFKNDENEENWRFITFKMTDEGDFKSLLEISWLKFLKSKVFLLFQFSLCSKIELLNFLTYFKTKFFLKITNLIKN